MLAGVLMVVPGLANAATGLALLGIVALLRWRQRPVVA
jgi:hypothetical protein